jgi:predicted nucleic acid-binding protein
VETLGVPNVVLFDTDVLIDYGRGDPHAAAVLDVARQEGTSAVSVIVHGELLAGCRDKREQSILDGFMAGFRCVHIDANISGGALGLLRRYRLSHGLRLPDALIAATALAYDWPLVTKNQKDYRFIEGLQLPPY